MYSAKYFTSVLLLFTCLIIIVGCKNKQPIEQGIPITVAKAVSRSLAVNETATGTLSSLHNVTVRAETAGRILNVLVDIGQMVKVGQLLIEINPIEQQQGMDLQANNVKSLEPLLVYQQKLVERYKILLAKKFIPQVTYDQAKARLESLEGQIAAFKARVANTQSQIDKTHITSPISAFVKTRNVLAGDFVTAGTPVLELVDTSKLRAKLVFPETMSNELKIGLPVTLSSIAAPREIISATITAINPVIDEASRSIEVVVDFANVANWPPGASVNGIVTIRTEPQVVMVPNESIVQRPQGFVVYTIHEHLAIEQPVEVGLEQQGWTVIKKGLEPNTMIAVDGAAYLSNRALVRYAQ